MRARSLIEPLPDLFESATSHRRVSVKIRDRCGFENSPAHAGWCYRSSKEIHNRSQVVRALSLVVWVHLARKDINAVTITVIEARFMHRSPAEDARHAVAAIIGFLSDPILSAPAVRTG